MVETTTIMAKQEKMILKKTSDARSAKDQIEAMKNEINDVRHLIANNIDHLVDRGDSLDELINRAFTQETAANFHQRRSRPVQFKEKQEEVEVRCSIRIFVIRSFFLLLLAYQPRIGRN